jgi:hypothetical protein
MNSGRYVSNVAAIPAPEIPTANNAKGSQQQAEAMMAEKTVPILAISSPRFDGGLTGVAAGPISESLMVSSFRAISTPFVTLPRQHEPDGFSVTQRQPGSFIFARMCCKASLWPFVRNSSLMLAIEWPKQ